MTRDYKHRTSRRQNSSAEQQVSIPVWRWILVCVVIATFVSGLLWLKSTVSNSTQQTIVKKPVKKPIKYAFYHVLPEREVIIPEHQIETQKRIERQQAKKKSGKKRQAGSYMIQAGAFEEYREADKRKAQLLLMGQNAFLEKAILEGRTWHRVKIGPFNSLNQADSVRKRLAREHILSVIMKQKP